MEPEPEPEQGRPPAPARVTGPASVRDRITRLDVRYGIITHAVLITLPPSPLKTPH